METSESYVDRVFSSLFPGEGDGLLAWQKAEMVLEHFNPMVVGEELALRCLCEIACRTDIPDVEKRTKIVFRAENKMPEILGVHPDHEFSSDEAEALLYEFEVNGRTMEQVSMMYHAKYPDLRPG